MQHRIHPILLAGALAACAILVGCPFPSSTAQDPSRGSITQDHPRIQGVVSFPDREVAATPTDITRRATVSVIDVNNQTVAAALTDSSGAFSFDPGFTPAAGTYYVLEAIKPFTGNTTAGRVARMRTIVLWNGTTWTSCTGATIQITATTTAVAVIEATQAAVGYPETQGVIANDAVVSSNPLLNANWQAVRDMVTQLLSRDLDPLACIVLSGSKYVLASDRTAIYALNLSQGATSSTSMMLDGSLQLMGSLPRPKSADEAAFAATGSVQAGVIATDGKYILLKPWTSSGTWKIFGSGFGGTSLGAAYGSYINPTGVEVSGAYYGSAIYQQLAIYNNTTLQYVATPSGTVGTIALTTPFLYRETGLTSTGSYVTLASDGAFLYNGAQVPTGFLLRIYDPSNGFSFVRQLSLDGSGTPLAGTTFADGNTNYFADGVYAYAMEWAANIGNRIRNGAARLRRFRLTDGQLEAETTFSQFFPTDDPLTGCYDWVNNKFYFADYQSEIIHRTAGRSFPGTGTWVSMPLDMGGVAPLYGRLNFNAVSSGTEAVRFRIRSANDANALQNATWYGPTGTSDYYTASGTAVNSVHHRNRWAQIQATLVASTDSVTVANTTPRLYGVNLEATP